MQSLIVGTLEDTARERFARWLPTAQTTTGDDQRFALWLAAWTDGALWSASTPAWLAVRLLLGEG
jgi:hypothetical protein